MSESQGPAAPASGPDDQPQIPTFEQLAADPEIAPLLDFEPVPRKRQVEGGWTPELQREFIARLAVHGSATKASDEMGKNQTGIMKLYRSPLGASFRAAWDAAVEVARRRREQALEFVAPGTMPPTIDHRRKHRAAANDGPSPGQMRNEYGEWEDEASLQRRGEDARDSISNKLQRARRLYLSEICRCPGKRAAFEILTELPVDWDKAERLEPQPDEPWRSPRMATPDMLLTAENGWLGDVVHGPDKKAELQKALNDYLAEQGLPTVAWGEEEE